MQNFDFTPVSVQPNAVRTNQIIQDTLVGLDGFLSRPINKEPSTEEINYTTPGQTQSSSNCSNYCDTSTCAECCAT